MAKKCINLHVVECADQDDNVEEKEIEEKRRNLVHDEKTGSSIDYIG